MLLPSPILFILALPCELFFKGEINLFLIIRTVNSPISSLFDGSPVPILIKSLRNIYLNGIFNILYHLSLH